jgi:ubiquinol-cytochrome c reductase cytochrome c subunit
MRTLTIFLLALISATSAHAQKAADGKRLYEDYGCYQCHGRVGQGAMATGPALAATRATYAAFSAYVRAPARIMPPYSAEILSEENLRSIFAYVGQMPPPRPAAQIPALNALLKRNAQP